MSSIEGIGWRPRLESAKSHYVLGFTTHCVVQYPRLGGYIPISPRFPVNTRRGGVWVCVMWGACGGVYVGMFVRVRECFSFFFFFFLTQHLPRKLLAIINQ